MLQIMGVENAASGGACLYQQLQSHWKHHRDDKCPLCHFKLILAGIRHAPRLVPRNRFWYFGLGRSIGDNMFGNTSWCRYADGQQDFHDYKTSAEFARLKEKLDHCAEYGLYEVGFDFGNMFQFCSWSTGVMLIRCIVKLLTAQRDTQSIASRNASIVNCTDA